MKLKKTNHRTKIWLNMGITVSILALSACGGGGGDEGASSLPTSSAPVNVSQDYSPDSSKLVSSAETSDELYVETDFRFNNTSTYLVQLSATRLDGSPVSNTLVNLYRVPGKDAELDETSQESAQQIAIGQTNHLGQFERSIELAESDSAILASINVVGSDSQVILSTSDAENMLISYHFSEL